jgi:hypothetical protein
MAKISKLLLSLSFLLSVLFIAAPASSADNHDGEWQSARSGDPFDPATFSFSPRAVAVYSEPLQEGEAFRISRPGNHNKVGHRIYVVSESAFKATGLTIGEYIQTGAVNYEMATLLWVNRDIDHDGNTAFWRAGFKPSGWNPQWTPFNRDLRGEDEPLHFFMFDNTVWYSEKNTHEANATNLRVDDMDPHGYSDPIMFFGYAHKRNDQTNIINAGVAPTEDTFSIVDVNLDNDCDGISNWEDSDDNAFNIGGGTTGCAEPCLQNASCGSPESTPPVASTPPTTPPTTPPATTTTSTTTTTTSTTTQVPEGSTATTSTTTSTPTTTSTTTTEDPVEPLLIPEPEPPEPPEPTLLPTNTEPPPTTEPAPTTTEGTDPPVVLPPVEDKECNCDDGMPWWFWFIIGNMSWMTIRYIIKHMKEAEEEKEEVASLLDEKEDEEVE